MNVGITRRGGIVTLMRCMARSVTRSTARTFTP